MDLCLIGFVMVIAIYMVLKCIAKRHYNSKTDQIELKNVSGVEEKLVNIYLDLEGDGWM